MDADRDQRLEELFAEALERPDDERAAWLEGAAHDDPELRAEVLSLLVAYALAPQWIDPSILGNRNAAGDTSPPALPAELTLGPWRILEHIATGGMGAVYRGERIDDSFRMQVAIKLLSARSFHPGLQSQFRRERQILADLDHPGIARLLDGGTTNDGTPYLVMEYIAGAPIHEAARDRHLSLVERLRLFLEVADAVQYAHSNLVVHRDLKPGNIVVRDDGHAKLLDFGIAKVFAGPRSPEDQAATMTSWALTPRYASPEQIRGERVTTATDIYSLGVVLYELLTGRLPHPIEGMSLGEISNLIARTPPVAPSRVPGLVDPRPLAGDLDTILLKALAREPERRYATMADFADDIRRHLDGEPVLARGDSAGYRIGRFARRNRLLVGGIVAIIATLLVALVVTLSFYHGARESARLARWYGNTATLAAVESAIMNHNMKEARELLAAIPPEARAWEYRHLERRLDRSLVQWQAHAQGITSLRYTADGSRLVSTGIDGAARLWNTESRDSIAAWYPGVEVESAAFLAGRDRLVLGLTDGRVVIATVGSPEMPVLGRGRSYAIVDVHPDGRTVAAGFDDGQVVLYDADEGIELRRWTAHPRLTVPRFSPAGTWLATAGSDSLVKLWDVGTGRLRSRLTGHRSRVFCLAFSQDGRRLASGSRDHSATVWDVTSGLALASYSEHRGTVGSLAFHPDGQTLLSSGSEGRVLAWDATTGARRGEYHGHGADVTAVDVSPDGTTSATGEWDGTIRLWSWGTDDVRILGPPPATLLVPLRDLVVDPSGKRLAVLNQERQLIVHEMAGGRSLARRSFHHISSVAFADSFRVLAGDDQGRIRIYADPADYPDTLVGHGGPVTALAGMVLAASPATLHIASGDANGDLALWTVPGMSRRHRWQGHAGEVTDLAFNTSGTVLASAGTDGAVRLWNPATGDSLAALRADDTGVSRLAFHPDGRRLVLTTGKGAALLWDTSSANSPDTLVASGNGAFSVTISPDGNRVVIGSADQIIAIIDVRRRSQVLRLHGHIARVSGVQFTPDGHTLLSSSNDGTVRVWDTE